MNYFIAFLVSFSLTFLTVPILIFVQQKTNSGEHPGGRRIHTKLIPSMGGIGILLSVIFSWLIWDWDYPQPDLRLVMGGICIMTVVGFRDDMVDLNVIYKIIGQLVAVLLVVVVGNIRIENFHGFFGIEELPLLVSYAFSAFVLLALTNAFNLIDGLDGLAGTIAAISLSLLGIWFYVQGFESLALLSFTFLGGVLSFLVFNWHPAKIFMGDTGSLALGFSLGTLIISFMDYNAALPTGAFLKFESTFSVGVVLMIYPLFDMARVFTKRISNGKHPMSPDRSHVHHFLMRAGLKHNEVTLLLGSIQLSLIGLVALFGNYPDAVVLPLLSAVVLVLGSQLNVLTVKAIRKKVANSPKIGERKLKEVQHVVRVKVDPQTIDSGNMNLN